jgi:hypothetical protein
LGRYHFDRAPTPGLLGSRRAPQRRGKHLRNPVRTGGNGCAGATASLHPRPSSTITATASGPAMGAEIEKIVEDIKQSVGLLRRHL